MCQIWGVEMCWDEVKYSHAKATLMLIKARMAGVRRVFGYLVDLLSVVGHNALMMAMIMH